MSNTKLFGVSVKDYAEQRGKTVQAVYQQMKRKENAAALKGHIVTHRVGNKNVKYLDEEAIAILDKSSNSAPLVIMEDGLRADLETTKHELQTKEKQMLYQEGQIQLLKEMLKERDAKLLALAESQSQIDTLKAQNVDLSGKIKELEELLAREQKTAQEASEELTAQKEENEELKSRKWYQLLFKR